MVSEAAVEMDVAECNRVITRVVSGVAKAREVDWKLFFARGRGAARVAEARVMAMGLCCEAGVRSCVVARAFKRSWATVYAARRSCAARYAGSEGFRREWEEVLVKVVSGGV